MKIKHRGFFRYTAFILLALIFSAAGFGCASEQVKLPQVDASLAETVVVTRNGWDRDILPSSSAEVKEFIDDELAGCKPLKAYESWDEAFPDGNAYGSPNTVTLAFPDESEVMIQCYLTGESYLNLIDRTGKEHLYLVNDAWLSNFIETVTEMVEQAPDERYTDQSEPDEPYVFNVMTDDNAPIGCEFGINKVGQMDALETLTALETLKGFVFPANSETVLRFFFSHEPEDVYVRYISGDEWQKQYPYENHRIKAPDKPGIYSIFVDIGWNSEYSETAFFSITVQDGGDDVKDSTESSPPQPTQPAYAVTAEPAAYDVSTESITVKITNNSHAEGGYGYAHRIEREISGRWEPLALDIAWNDIWVILPVGQTNTETFSLHREQYDYQPGAYRIVFTDGLGGASVQFTLTGKAKPTYSVAADPNSYPVNAESITVKIANTSQIEGGYGYAYRIEREINGKWEAVPLEFDVMAIAAILPAGQASKETFSLHQEQYNYRPGTYRIVFLDGLGGVSAQFTLT